MPQKLATLFSTRKKGKRNLSLKSHYNFYKIQIILKELKEAPGFACQKQKASFTVEAAVVLPVVLMVCVAMLYFFRILQVETGVQSAINYAARETAVYAGEIADTPIEKAEVLLQLKAKRQTKNYVKNSGCKYSFIEHGLSGISFAGSEYAGDEVSLCVTYDLELPLTFFGKKNFTVTQCSLAHKWTGKSVKSQEEQGIWVYITANGTAYHKTDDCSYLKLSIKSVSRDQVEKIRNVNGGKYYPCSACKAKSANTVYVTDYGTKYHASLECSGLKRTIYHVRLDRIDGYHPCKKCYGS